MPRDVSPRPASFSPRRWLVALRRQYPGWPPLLLLSGAATKLLLFGLRQSGVPSLRLLELIDTLGSVLLLAGLLPLLVRAFGQARRRLLWRVRGKLVLSYVFIGVFPVLLVIAFFLLSGLLLFLNVSSYMVASSVRNLTEEARFLAETTVLEIQKSGGGLNAQAVLDRKAATLAGRYRGASIALVPTPPEPCAGRGAVETRTGAGGAASLEPPPSMPPPATRRAPAFAVKAVGPWSHVPPPEELPVWVGCSGFGGLIPYPVPPPPGAEAGQPAETRLVIRGAALPEQQQPAYAVIVDIPLNEEVSERLREETSVKLEGVTLILDDDEAGSGNAGPEERVVRPSPAPETDAEPGPRKVRIPWVTFLERVDWETGRTHSAAVSILLNIADIYDRLSEYQARVNSGGVSLGGLILYMLVVVAGLFLIIEGVALVMGLALGRSITSSVHELFAGTERVRQGDFGHRIHVRADDQLGQLAASFNSMTSSIEDLLQQAAEKKRMEEELRIAREIQMSLLPRGDLSVPGLSISALCVPAREVGGDYYDVLRLDDGRLGILIADVSGKGTSAALYMAELKGVVLSLAKTYRSPRQLLLHANGIISENLDSRSFITMTYAVIDLEGGTMSYARAGHTPLVYRSARTAAGDDGVRILVPDGLVLGLQLDEGRTFERLLEEATLPLGPGDVLVFFTDGISEAMNAAADCYGEARLGQLVGEHGHLPPDQLRERILRDIDAFVAGAPQHDDMTLIIVRVEHARAGAPADAGAAAAGRG